MGTYLYTIRTKSIRVELPTGQLVHAHLLQYQFRCEWYSKWWGKSEHGLVAIQEAQIARCRETWIDRKWRGLGGIPQYVVMCDDETGPQPGDAVYRWDDSNPYWFDTDKINGEVVGYLKTKTRRARKVVWTSSASTWSVQYGELKGGCFHVKGSKLHFSWNNADAFAQHCRSRYGHVETHTNTSSL